MLTDSLQSSPVNHSASATIDGGHRADSDSGATIGSDDRMCFDVTGPGTDADNLLSPSTSSYAATVAVTDNVSASSVAAYATAVVVSFDFRFVVPLVALVVFNLVVVIGNSLVVAAVFTHRKLRTVTNVFIVSLATSDLLLGLLVLPSSSAYELLGNRWPFGRIWCDAWLAIDVWLCTASILNLCAISLDRYLAISRPFRYPTLMSPTRARVAVALVWTLALAICVPPLLGWRDSGDSSTTTPVAMPAPSATLPTRRMTNQPPRTPALPSLLSVVAQSRRNADDDGEMASFLEYADDVYAAAAAASGTTSGLTVGHVWSAENQIGGFLGRFKRNREMSAMASSTASVLQTLPGDDVTWSERADVVVINPKHSSTVYFNVKEQLSDGDIIISTRFSSLETEHITSTATFLNDQTVPTDGVPTSYNAPTITAADVTTNVVSSTDGPTVTRSELPLIPVTLSLPEIRKQLPYDDISDIETANDANRPPSVNPMSVLPGSSRDCRRPFTEQIKLNTNSDDVNMDETSSDSVTSHGDKSGDGYMLCALTSEPGYIVYSACGSFWIPMLIMTFFYVRIYRTAIRATDALRRGVVTTKTGSTIGLSSSTDGSLSLRVHRGGGRSGSSMAIGHSDSMTWTSASIRFINGSHAYLPAGDSLPRNSSHAALFADFRYRNGSGENGNSADAPVQPLPASAQSSCCDSISGADTATIHRQPASGAVCSAGCRASVSELAAVRGSQVSSDFGVDSRKKFYSLSSANAVNGRNSRTLANGPPSTGAETSPHSYSHVHFDSSSRPASGANVGSLHRCLARQQLLHSRRRPPPINRSQSESMPTSHCIGDADPEMTLLGARDASLPGCSLVLSAAGSHDGCGNIDDDDDDDVTSTPSVPRSVGVEHLLRSALTPVYEHCPAARLVSTASGHSSSSATSRRGLLNIKTQLRRLNHEKKAAKTVGIIVGCFIVCWTPFFSVYVLGAFCSDCTPAVVFTVFFWLGYCNSAINPFVYALCSRDFRDAFRRLLRCGRGVSERSGSSVRRLTRDRGGYGLAALVRGLGPHRHQQAHHDEYA